MTYEIHAAYFQPSVDPLAVTESAIITEAPPITFETTAIAGRQSPDDISMMPPVNGICICSLSIDHMTDSWSYSGC
jgi:hypothetical protein